MLDLYDFFGVSSIGMTPEDLRATNSLDMYILDTIKQEAANGDKEAQKWLQKIVYYTGERRK